MTEGAGDDDGELSCDAILRGRLRLWQPRVGYRFSVDSLLLVDFVAVAVAVGRRALGRVCDLGAGVGVIGLGLALRDPAATVTLAELQPRLVRLARRNVDENRLGERVSVVAVDLADARAARAALPGAGCDLVVTNPPYQALGHGPANPVDEAAIARHELRLTLADVAREARRLLVPGGRVAVVYPAARLPALLGALDGAGLTPLKLRAVHARAAEPAGRVLVEAVKGGQGGLTVAPPLVLRDDDDAYTAEAARALGES